MTQLNYGAQYALLQTFRGCLESCVHISKLPETIDNFIVAFDVTVSQAEALQELKKRLADGLSACEIFKGCDAFDKRITFFLTLPHPVNAGRWTDSFDLALDYIKRFHLPQA